MTEVQFEKLSIEEIEPAVKEIVAIASRLLVDQVSGDRRQSRKLLETRYLAVQDLRRAADSLKEYGQALREENERR